MISISPSIHDLYPGLTIYNFLKSQAEQNPDRVAIAVTKWKDEWSQHMYAVVRLGSHWYYLDPAGTSATKLLIDSPVNVGFGARDYRHHFKLNLLPGSTLTKPMLVE